jgi:hypothetical protein
MSADLEKNVRMICLQVENIDTEKKKYYFKKNLIHILLLKSIIT